MMKFLLFGHPVAHSLSARMHAANFKALSMDATYEARDVEPEQLKDALAEAVREGVCGLNLTLPHKCAALALLDKVDESAVRYNAVNTVHIVGGKTFGYNTDVFGFLKDLEVHGVSVPLKRILVLGAGGAGRSIARACLDCGAGDVMVANRTVREGMIDLNSEECRLVAQLANIIINATSVGLKATDGSPLDVRALHAGQVVYDCCPVAHTTQLIAAARAAGAQAIDGKGMLVHQAAKAFEIWTGRKANIKAMTEAIA